MYNLYLMEVVNLPQHKNIKDDLDETLHGECKNWFYGLCGVEWGEQVGPCIGCPYKNDPYKPTLIQHP